VQYSPGRAPLAARRQDVRQVRRYEAGTAQPTRDAVISLARALRVGT
jgi:hypothetical protein